MTYSLVARAAEAGTSVKPIIVSKLVYLYALSISWLMRHGLCHHQRLGLSLGRELRIRSQVGGKFEMLLQGQLRRFVWSQDGKSRHDFSMCAQTRRDSGNVRICPENDDASEIRGFRECAALRRTSRNIYRK
jgi:hypothetical protein